MLSVESISKNRALSPTSGIICANEREVVPTATNLPPPFPPCLPPWLHSCLPHHPALAPLLVGPAVAAPLVAVVELGDTVDERPPARVFGPLFSLVGVPGGDLSKELFPFSSLILPSTLPTLPLLQIALAEKKGDVFTRTQADLAEAVA